MVRSSITLGTLMTIISQREKKVKEKLPEEAFRHCPAPDLGAADTS